ncbi:hypothetical protein, partial [Aurantimonas sp. 22II-16-19i]|uniref:hypothetical protein n=1 Tax=Aurantimonas sp. 22II-16-19i TaxID=1317114 RepID=UPI001AECA845
PAAPQGKVVRQVSVCASCVAIIECVSMPILPTRCRYRVPRRGFMIPRAGEAIADPRKRRKPAPIGPTSGRWHETKPPTKQRVPDVLPQRGPSRVNGAGFPARRRSV